MRILYHHRTASRDGQVVHIEEVITGLRRLGHDVRVVGPSNRLTEMGAHLKWVHRFKRLAPRAIYELLELAYSIPAYLRLARAIREFRPDVIYERYNLFLVAGLMAKRRLHVPLVLEVNAPLARERSAVDGLSLARIAYWTERMVWLGADRVLAVTQVLADYVASVGVSPDKTFVVTNGVDAAHFATESTHAVDKDALGLSDALVLGFTGFVREWHGVDHVIRWLAMPSSPENAHLLIVGDGPARAGLEQLAASSGVAERVTFVGTVSRDRVPAYVAMFDIALQPAVVAYASPLKVFEYLAMGKAIVAPRTPNLEEILEDGVNVLFFEPDEPGALARALDRLAAEPALRKRLAAGAARTIHDRGLAWDDVARRIAQICENVSRRSSDGSSLSPQLAAGSAGRRDVL